MYRPSWWQVKTQFFVSGRLNTVMENLNFREFIETYDNMHWKVLDLYSSRVKVHDIRRITGLPVAEIYRILERHGKRPDRQIPRHNVVMTLHDMGSDISDIAAGARYSTRHVYRVLKKGA